MTRPLFDPKKMAVRKSRLAVPKPGGVSGADGVPAPASGGQPEWLSVTQLAGLIDGALREGVPKGLKVVGEVSGFRDRSQWYFDLKDGGAVVNCVMFSAAAIKAGFTPKDGMEVVVKGRVEFYARQGRAQFYVERIEPVGEGALDLKFRALVEELRGLGWLSPERKRPVPRFPRRVAVLTSRTGAALQDVLDTMRRRCPAVDVLVVDVRVQGDRACDEVAAALAWVGAAHARLGIDAVLITRGGGSKEDLWTFNERAVAAAIVRCPVPVVAAIGHETDTTIAELVADERCATPTQAAMRLTPDRASLCEQIDQLEARLGVAVRKGLRHEAEKLRSATRHPFFTDPRLALRPAAQRVAADERALARAVRAGLAGAAHRAERSRAGLERHRPGTLIVRRAGELDGSALRMRTAVRGLLSKTDVSLLAQKLRQARNRTLERAGLRLDAAARGLELVGPASVFRRGYSCTLRADGRAVRSAGEVMIGELVTTRVADGAFASVVLAPTGAAGSLDGAATPGSSLAPIADPPPAPKSTVPTAERKARQARLKGVRRRGDPGPGLFGG